jgi:two-component system sensor histidine kinase YesM
MTLFMLYYTKQKGAKIMHLSLLSIKKQFKIILACLLALYLVLAMLSYITLDHLMVKNSTEYAQNTSQKFNREVQYLFKRVDSIFVNLLFDQNIEHLMLSPYTTQTQRYIKSLLVKFSSYSIMNQDISDIGLITKDLSWSNTFDTKTLTSFAKEMEGIYGPYSFGIQQSTLTNNNAHQGSRLVFGYNVFGMYEEKYYGKYLGGIILSIDPAKSPITLPGTKRSNTYFLLADKDSDAFPFNCSEEMSKKIISDCGDLSKYKDSDTQVLELRDYLIYITPIPDMGYYMISAIDRRALNKDIIHATILIVLVVLAAFLIIAALMYTILHNMVTPLDAFSRYIQQIKRRPLNGNRQDLILKGCSEISTLSQSFNELLEESEQLNKQLYEATVNLYETKLGKKQAELQFLRSQISPHFLYNALESVKDIALEQNVPEIATIAGAMGKLFRYNVKGHTIVSLEQEIEITTAYLDIQQARFPEKLNVLYSIRENVMDIPIMKFLLQPLVENAVYHGLEPTSKNGTLFIGAHRQNDLLLITIQDDGVGIPHDNLTLLQQQLLEMKVISDFTGQHIGLLNVQHRLLLNYGSEYGLTIESSEGEGTKVMLRIPIINSTIKSNRRIQQCIK